MEVGLAEFAEFAEFTNSKVQHQMFFEGSNGVSSVAPQSFFNGRVSRSTWCEVIAPRFPDFSAKFAA